ncbi:SCO-spondin-like isoform X4 [Dreissena polymorpha]|nr:SCO-spondin-like isoform X4 [Dreissena polymorpha]
MHLVVLVGWLFLLIESVAATQCLSCAPMPSSVPCITTTNCTGGQECYAKYVMKPDGTVIYEFGCHSSQTCPGQMGTHALIGKRATGDIELCSKFCQGVMCNQGTLCTGITAPTSTTSPFTTSSTIIAPTTPANPCFPSPCVHGSCFISSANSLTFFCMCQSGFEGVHCETTTTSTMSPSTTTSTTTAPTTPANPCFPSPCVHGSCFISSGNSLTFFCLCPIGFEGVHCETTSTSTTLPSTTTSTTAAPTTPANPCFPSPCVHGSCFISSGNSLTFFCMCPIGFEGVHCETIITSTASTTTHTLPQPPVDGHWCSWSVWSLCTSDCHQTRTRVCDNPAPLHGGKDCHGPTTDTRDCYTSPCRVDGHWSSWTTWSFCTSHCNQTRTRACANPAPLHGGKDCHGPTTDTRDCYTSPCRVDGHWGSWTTWSLCTSHCNQTRTRACDNPAPLHGGKDCHGATIQTHDCYTASCRLKDCSQLLSSSVALPSGVYTLTTPLTHAKVQVYCDMGTDGGGWTIFQRRFDGSVDFHRNFRNYEYGFGDVVGEHWLGLKYIYEITSNGYFQLRVNITRNDGRKAYDVYGNFRLQPGPRYTLNLGAQLKSHGVEPSSDTFFTTSSRTPVGSAFSTYDHDSDKFADGNCAELYKGGWWYNDCYMNINLNGLYQPGISKTTSMIYDGFPGLKSSTIMFKEIFKK